MRLHVRRLKAGTVEHISKWGGGGGLKTSARGTSL